MGEMSGQICVPMKSSRGEGLGIHRESDLNKILLLSKVGPPGVLLEGGDDRGRRRAETLRACVGELVYGFKSPVIKLCHNYDETIGLLMLHVACLITHISLTVTLPAGLAV